MGGRGPSLFHSRHWSRRLALQALYQWQMTGQDVGEIEAQFAGDGNFYKADRAYFEELLHQVPSHLSELDSAMNAWLDRPIEYVDPVERAVLRNACYELAHRLDVPYKVIINEAVALTKQFGAAEGHKFVNGVLDKLVMQFRPDECQAILPG